ncbi:glycosyltransferase family 2 protein [Leadbettera azotonutricia]|uniref:Glycosyltransferase, involved in cell wall biogenesis n=1 Tax=Leadbettera azotonutricia (strain ATCC BAA-888 / DSM 13862 / ZAS-9) TaxID=545695 RepID=F5Y747_LEAAZ|nr:glycosyltransferase family 2 protein [Leadbettera azotonutricia]AEF82376.1 glycosyltransferase, involved in cell wall biogenesis [Leadbettera azotonutricia ZAS-9]
MVKIGAYILSRFDVLLKSVNKSRSSLKNLVFVATIISTAVYLIWRMFFTLPWQYGAASIIAGLLMLVSEILSTLQALDKFSSVKKGFEPPLPTIPDEWFCDVDIFIATHNESAEILFKTVNGCTHMEYPDKNKVHVYLCDDGNRSEIAALAKELGIGYFGLARNKLLKAGNLNNAMRQTHAPLCVTFDADMIPTRYMLTKTVPYFYLPFMKQLPDDRWILRELGEIDPDYRIGFIQTPQSFYNPDLFQYNLYSEGRIPNEQDYFFREINVIRNASNAPIYAGSNTVISRIALEQVGYIATGTITEDFATGLKIQRKGWITYGTSTPLAHGLAPDDIESLVKQRERWGRGCIQSLQNMNIVGMKDLPFLSKISYINCYFYWWSFLARFIFIAAPILFAVFHLRILVCSVQQFFIFWLPYFILSSITSKLTAGATRNQHWNGVIDTIMFPYLMVPIVKEALGFKLEKFAVTRKDKATGEQKSTFYWALPHLMLLISCLAALGICVKLTLQSATMYNIVMMYWLVINSKNLVLAIFFMMGRKNTRSTERFYVTLPITIHGEFGDIHAMTTDISEEGLAFTIDRPEFISPDTDLSLILEAPPYTAKMVVRVLHIDNRNNNAWKYCVRILTLDRYNIRQYFQIIYDRHHSLPDKIAENWSLYDDYQIQLNKRSSLQINAQRKLPRVELSAIAARSDGSVCMVTSFNYYYLSFRFFSPWPEGDDEDEVRARRNRPACEIFDEAYMEFEGYNNLPFHIAIENKLPGGDILFSVINWRTLLNNKDYPSLIDKWVAGVKMEALIRGERSLPELPPADEYAEILEEAFV